MGRLDTYQEISIIRENENKRISIVRSEIDGLCYIKEEMKNYNLSIWKQLYETKINGIPQIDFYQETDGRLIVIEEYVNYPTLDQYVLNHSIDSKEARIIILKLCRILKQLHALNPPVIHRDIKLENIFYNGKDLYLFDFDISRNPDEEKKQDTVIVGSIGYAAPEQYGFMQSDQRSDIYSLGILFHVLLTNHFPTEVDYQGEYHTIIEKMIQIDPASRPESIQKVEDLLNRKLDFTPPGFRTGKMINKVIALIVYGFIAFFVIVYIWSTEEKLSNNIGASLMSILMSLIAVGYVSNYLECWRHALFHKKKSKLIRITGVIMTFIIAEAMGFGLSILIGTFLESLGI